ncbi:MAG: transglutaminase domain-containing protein [Faecousia sp.]
MKHEKFLTGLTAAVLAFFTAWGASQCFITAFGLPMEHPEALVPVCAGMAMGAALLFSLRHGGTVLLCLAALACGYIHHDGTALRQFWQLLRYLSTIYNRAYGFGVLVLPDSMETVTGFDWPLGIWACLMAMAVCRSVCRPKSVWLPMLTTILPLCSCIVVTDTVPDDPWLLMLMASLILLLLTSPVRQEHNWQSLRLTAAAALPVVLALSGLFLAFPRETYKNDPQSLRENILAAVQSLPQQMERHMNRIASNLLITYQKQIDLAHLGARIPMTRPVMQITAEETGPLYLRQQDFDLYDGLGWSATTDREEPFGTASGREESIRVLPLNQGDLRILPYYPHEATTILGGSLPDPAPETQYTLLRRHLPADWRQRAYSGSAQGDTQWQQYCALPEESRQAAEALLAGWLPGTASNTEKADLIAALVTDSARYDLDPSRMPDGESDFALWFLRDGEKGYCVHFATAATVLLRAADVPARYVTGYLLEAEAGRAVTVTEENAHAWAEYYEPNLDCWIPLEATPAAESSVPDPLPATAPSEATEPAQTVPPVTDSPTEATAPSTSVSPEEPDDSTPPSPPAAAPQPGNPAFLLALLMVPLLGLLLAAQRWIRLALRRRKQRTGPVNAQALHRWQEAVRLSRLLKESPTEELMVLAQKAKFSQYELTQEELARFDSFNRSCLRRLREKPRYLGLIYQYIYAAY